MHRVVGRADARNRASVHAMERLGLRREGLLVESERRGGEWIDSAMTSASTPSLVIHGAGVASSRN